MRVREVVIDTGHSVVLVSGALVGGDEVPSSVTVICSIRKWDQVKELLYARIDSDGNAPVWRGVTAGRWVTVSGQQALVGKRVRHCGDCRGCLYFPKPLIVREKKGATTKQRPAHSGTELVADKRGNWSAT